MDISTILQPHQKQVVDKLNNSDAVLVYHGIGSGKSLTSIAATGDNNVDVVVPASLRNNYVKELEKFRADKSLRNIISYNKFIKTGPSTDSFLVLDEPQKIGRVESKISQSVIDFAKQYNKRILLSGTPAQNHPHELAPIVRILSPTNKEVPLDPASFKSKFLADKEKPLSLWNYLRGLEPGVETVPKNLEVLQNAIKGKVSYHSPSKDNYPVRIDKIKKIEASPEQLKYYKYVTSQSDPIVSMKVERNLPLSKKELSNLNSFMAAARQVSNSTTPYGGKSVTPKIQAVVDDFVNKLNENKDHKGLIYSNYLDAGINEVAKQFDAKKIPYVKFIGSMNDAQRKDAVNKYNSGEFKAILVSGSGSEGLDLKNTRSIQILEPHWHQSRIEQVIGRGVRYKSHANLPEADRNVEVIKYQTVLPNTIIGKILRRDAPTSADTYLENLSNEKQRILNKFLDVFKREVSQDAIQK